MRSNYQETVKCYNALHKTVDTLADIQLRLIRQGKHYTGQAGFQLIIDLRSKLSDIASNYHAKEVLPSIKRK